jgi:hypothetical protein
MALIISEPQTRKLIDMPAALKVVDKMFPRPRRGKARSSRAAGSKEALGSSI